VDYSFDVWGLGLTLFEIAVGEPLFTLQRTYDVEYIKERLKYPDGIIAEANKKMWKVESGARSIIRQCLVVDPERRGSCEEMLQHAYFQRQHSNSKQPNVIK
jgi:calcium-dependent protein kinase